MIELLRSALCAAQGRTRAASGRARTISLAGALLVLNGCAGDAFVKPTAFDEADMRARAQSVSENGVTASATIPSREETVAIFGVDLLAKDVQPVWIEIVNDTDRVLYLLKTGLDPEYFSPREVAFALSESMSDEARRELVEHIEELDFRDPVEPRTTVSGFVLTYRDRESKFVGIDLLSNDLSAHLALVVPNPDRTLTEDRVRRLEALAAASTPVDAESASKLRGLLERLPCCAADENGVQGEPLNVVLVGDVEAIGPALVRRGFRYHDASPLYAFARPHDFSMAKRDIWVTAQPHVLRLWLTDIRFQGKLVWVGQISMPLGGRFAGPGDESVPQRIDPDVDSARDDFLQDGFYSQLVTEAAFVKGVGAVSRSSPRMTPRGSTYHTDGLRAVLFYDDEPVSLTEIEFIGWERLIDHRRP